MKFGSQKLRYDVKYTAGSFVDAALSIPIGTGLSIARGAEKLMGEKTPEFLQPTKIKENSEIYSSREGLRQKLDTRPGTLYLQSNLVGTIPLFLVGMPAAEYASAALENMAAMSEMTECAANSAITVLAQYAVANGAVLANEVRVNFHKYSDNGKISWKKVGKGAKNLLKSFLPFDLTYFGIKSGLQAWALLNNQDPWESSAIADAIGLPAWYALTVPLGLHGGLIETNRSNEVYGRQNQPNQNLESKIVETKPSSKT